ncbi:hypothetical protein EDB19DRAFT_1644337 [Suillus lakei]|nr:hypothetical protein EDB19DRAFT_1644337 [Suillus lakei]
MGFHKISCDVKLAAIRLHEWNLLSLPDILDSGGFSEHTWFQILRLWRETGNVVNCQPSAVMCGHLHALDREDIDCLLHLVRQSPDYFLDELVHLLTTNQFISVHFMTIFHKLEHADVSYKKLKRIAKEHNGTLHAAFIARMAQYDPSELGFIDEMSKDDRCLYVCGWWTSTEALLTLDGIVAATFVEGSMTQELFLEWLENIVVSLVMNMYCRILM